MKKQIISVCVAVASAVAVASSVESTNIFGVMKVSTGLNGSGPAKEFIVAVPWGAVGSTADAATAPTNMVATTGLANGDMLYYFNPTDSKFYAWTISDGAWATAIISEGDEVYVTGNDSTIGRGQALILKTAQENFYLNGQYISGTKSTAIVAGNSVTAKWNLVAPTIQSGTFNLNGDGAMSGTPNADDYIITSENPGRKYTYLGGSWGYTPASFGGARTEGLSISAGQGLWYVSKGGSPTFNW